MSHMFSNAIVFNQDIGGWDTSRVTDMSHMFEEAFVFDQDFEKWDTSNVMNMSHMFQGASAFNGYMKFNTSNVIDMSHMFSNAIVFNQDIGQWDTHKVTDMSHMFSNAIVFNQYIGQWDTSIVTDMSHMFEEASVFNQDFDKWDTSNVINMSHMFQGANSFNGLIVFKTSKVTDMSYMFYNAIIFNQDIQHWNTKNVTNMSHMFDNANSFKGSITGYIHQWDPNIYTDITHINVKSKPIIVIERDRYEQPLRTSSELHMMIPPPTSTTIHPGSRESYTLGMLYLLDTYPESCVAIHSIVFEEKKINYYDYDLTWYENIKDFVIPSGFWSSIKKCLEKRSNFILIPFTFRCINRSAHSNFLIYDSKRKELERFEPNGFISDNCFNPPNLEEKLADLLNSNVQVDMVKKVYAPLSFCPRISFQSLQHREREKQIGDPGGFCAAWIMWYADTRLENPNKTRKQVVEMALLKFKNNIGSMTEFIRSYSAFIAKVGSPPIPLGSPPSP